MKIGNMSLNTYKAKKKSTNIINFNKHILYSLPMIVEYHRCIFEHEQLFYVTTIGVS